MYKYSLFDGDFDLNGNYYYQQNNYGGYPTMHDERFVEKNTLLKKLRFIGTVAGACIVLYVLFQNALSIPFAFEPLRSAYVQSAELRNLISIVFSIVGLLLPFAFGGLILRKKKTFSSLCLDKPHSTSLMLSSVPFGFLICLIGNYLTGVFISLTRASGIELTAPEYTVPDSLGGRFIYTLAIAVVPALVEEFAIRGVVMQPLRRYGDRFAIVASAMVFAILHGNLVQAPFAFIAGIGIGYAVCISGSVWTGVLIHFCNNFYSVVSEFMLADIADRALLNVLWNILQTALYSVSIIGSILFIIIKGRRKLTPAEPLLSAGEKWGAIILNPTMIIAIFIMLLITAQYINLI